MVQEIVEFRFPEGKAMHDDYRQSRLGVEALHSSLGLGG